VTDDKALSVTHQEREYKMKYILKSFITRFTKKTASTGDNPLFDEAGYNRIVKNLDRDLDRLWALVGGRPEETASTPKRRAPKKKAVNADVSTVR
jgi:hypothetical protein